jgi:hypothetical protein
MNKLFLAILGLPNVLLEERFSADIIKQVLEDSLEMKVSVDHGELKYQANGRASGDGWTTAGNTFLMISYWMYTFKLAGLGRKDYFLRVKGDDVLFAFSKKYKEQVEVARKITFTETKDWQTHGLGQICKKIDYGEITQLDFLSNYFFYTDRGTLRMTRIPERVFQTTSYSTKLRPDDKVITAEYLCYSKGNSLLAWAKGLPIFEVLAYKMIELGREGGKVSEYSYYQDYGRSWIGEDNDRKAYCRFLNERYGLCEDMVHSIENRIRNLKKGDQFVEIPELAMFFKN